MSEQPAEPTVLDITWGQAIAAGVFTGPQIQFIAQRLGGIPEDQLIDKETYMKLLSL